MALYIVGKLSDRLIRIFRFLNNQKYQRAAIDKLTDQRVVIDKLKGQQVARNVLKEVLKPILIVYINFCRSPQILGKGIIKDSKKIIHKRLVKGVIDPFKEPLKTPSKRNL